MTEVAAAARGDDNPKNFVNSVAKVFAVLKAFDTSLPELTITEVAGRAALDRGTAFRLVHTLCQLGYLAPAARPKRYRLTLKCLELGYTPLARADIKTLARPLLQELVPAVADAASLGMLDGPDVVYVERAQAAGVAGLVDRRPGSRTGAYAAALGHAVLAHLPIATQRAVLESSNRIRLSERTLTDVDEIMERLAAVAVRGYAVSDGENAYGLRTVAAAILDTDGSPVAGVSLTILSNRASLDDFLGIAAPAVRRVAGELTRAVALTFRELAQAR